jgi:hypothetical protein
MRLIARALIAVLSSSAAAPVAAQVPDIVVRGDARTAEIERILEADNLDTTQLDAREVADAIGAIPRGRAPRDFWHAYTAHVAAWRRLADAVEAARRQHPSAQPDDSEAVIQAGQAIEATFDEVEAIARRYGARLPTPPWQRVPTI